MEIKPLNSNLDNSEQLKINKKLPIVVLPENKVDMMIDWYNEDIRYQKEIPHSFNEGYMRINSNIFDLDYSKIKNTISKIAKQTKTTFRYVELFIKHYIEKTKNITIYFKMTGIHTDMKTYSNDNKLLAFLSFDVDTGDADRYEDLMSLKITEFKDIEDMQNQFNIHIFALFASTMWYLATTTKNIKYYYESKNYYTDKKIDEKDVIKIQRNKTISTPIYDLNKIKRVKIDHLITRRKGWTYSHAFQVHGHFRHYRNGKTIFIDSYIKGKNKEYKQQEILVNPK